MKKTISLLSNLLLSSTLLWGVPLVEADEIVQNEGAGVAGYCHMKFAPMEEAMLSWEQPELAPKAVKRIDSAAACDHLERGCRGEAQGID